MASAADEEYLAHIETISIAICGTCGKEVKEWDEMQLVKKIKSQGWIVHDGDLQCTECRSGEHTSRTGHKFDTINLPDSSLPDGLKGIVTKPKLFIPKGK